MRKILLISTAVIALCFLLWNIFSNKKISNIGVHRHTAQLIKDTHDEEDEGEEEDGIIEAQKMEFEITKDVSLGYIPKFRLINAFEKLKAEKLRPSPNTPNNIETLSWTERGPNSDVVGPSNSNTRAGNGKTSGRIRAIWVDLSDPTYHTIWVGGVDGGIWKTNDISASPATWTPVNDFFGNMAIGSICQSPLGTKDTMYFGTGEKTYNADAVRGGGVWKSVDHGVTWNLLPNTTSFFNVSKIICDAAGNVYVSTIGNGRGIQRSTNGGATWTNITPSGLNTSVTDMKLSNTGRMHIVCGYYNGASAGYRFTDKPATVTDTTWTFPTTPFPNVQYNCELAVTGSSLYVLAANSSYQTPQVYKSIDGGDNWLATASSPPASSGTNDLSSGQAWYNMAIAVDTSNDQNVLVGGLNCYRSINGGNNWAQISTWVGTSKSYVHADQQTATWNGNQVLVGSDGGIFYSSDAGATFKDRNEGLRLKQFYSCAMHPTNVDYFLAGAQDNGVNQLTNAGLGSSTEVTGGDGAFVQIDQDQPQYQFGSYTYNNYKRSTDGGTTWSSVDYSSTIGQFINPTDYDNINNKMYAGGASNQYIRWENPQTGNTFTPVTISAFSGSVRSISVSPYTSNEVYFGTSSGKIVKVDNANTASPSAVNLTGTGMPSTTVSCLAIGTDDKNIIATYSNYGVVKHIWATADGGSTWTNITGNFPDIPVRWAIFYPEDNTKAVIATEMGVYETTNINGASTVWTRDPTFPIVRTDMLKYRKSDGTIAAATHGRGLWTANIPLTVPYVRFTYPFNDVAEQTEGTDGCRNYKDYTLNLTIDKAPAGNANITVSVASGATAIQGADFDFTTNGNFSSPSHTVVFADGSVTPQPVTIRVYDDAEVESKESFTLNYTVTGSTNAQAAPSSKSYSFSISDNDFAPSPTGPSGLYTIGSANYYLGSTSDGPPFNAKLPGMRSQMLYKASELTSAGIKAGTITSIAFNIDKSSARPYKNLQIKMGDTTITNLVNGSVTNVVATSTVKSLASYNTIDGWNTFTLDVPFVWDGTSSVVIEICYNNTTGDTTDFADRAIGYNDGSTVSQGNLIWQDSINCSGSFTDVSYYSSGTKPEIQLNATANGNLIATSGSRSEYIGNNGTYYFYTDKNIINSITAASASLGCVSSNLAGTGNTWQPFFGGMRSQKVFDIVPSSNATAAYTVSLYFTTDELAGLDPATLQMAKTDAATIATANASNTVISTTTHTAYANGYLFTASFTGFSKFFLVNANVVLPVTLLSFDGNLSNNSILLNWKTSSEHNLKYFDVEKSSNSKDFYAIGKINTAGNSSLEKNYDYKDLQVSELNYYRLKMVDADGKFLYSSTILIKAPNIAQRLWIGSNPFHDIINVRLAKIPKQNVKIELLNASGAKVYGKEFGSSGDIIINTSGMKLASGIYVIHTTVDGKTYVNKVVKQ